MSVRNGIWIFDRPADLAAQHLGVPDAVPLPVVEAGAAESVTAHQARRVHLEEITRLLVVEGVDGPHEAIVGREELVAAALVTKPLVGLGIKAGHAHEQRLVVVDDPDLGLLGGRPPVLGVLLHEAGGGRRALPRPFIEAAVERDGFPLRHAHCNHRRPHGCHFSKSRRGLGLECG